MIRGGETYEAINGSDIDLCDMSTPRYVALRLNGSMERLFRARTSFFPISIIVPPSEIQRHESSRMFPVREFKMTSTPLPSVISMIWEANTVDREEKMCSGGIPKVEVRKSRFLSVPTVANI